MGIRRPLVHSRDRRSLDPGLPPAPGAVTVSAAVSAATTLTVTFGQPVSIPAVPQFATQSTAAGNPSQLPKSAAYVGAGQTIVLLTYPDNVDPAFDLQVPFQDPGIRGKFGAFVPAGSYDVT